MQCAISLKHIPPHDTPEYQHAILTTQVPEPQTPPKLPPPHRSSVQVPRHPKFGLGFPTAFGAKRRARLGWAGLGNPSRIFRSESFRI
jgi:hypothetical protein